VTELHTDVSGSLFTVDPGIRIMSFCVGDRVKIVNLKKKTDLNGLRGIIIQEGELKGDRFGVQIVKTKKKYKLKPENLAFGTSLSLSLSHNQQTNKHTHTHTQIRLMKKE